MKLSVELGKWRTDRPDEWKMDEFMRNAEKLESERDAALAREAELVAQVEVLRIAALNAIQRMSGGEAKADLRDAYDATPTQHLRDIQAEAGRAGFVAGYDAGHTYRFANIGNELADEYAERVKAGE